MSVNIQTIGILGGTNGIGESFAKHLRAKFPKKEILVTGRKTELSNKKCTQVSDLVIFSVPIIATEKLILELAPLSRKDQIWIDFTSIKVFPVTAMLQSKSEVCGTHPMFGPAPDITGQKIIFTPARISTESLEQLKEVFEDFEQITSTPEEHDRIMSVVQGLSHFSDFITGATIKELGIPFEKILQFSSPPYQLKLDVLGRMFAQNPNLYAQIATQNPQTIQTTQIFFETFQKLKDLVDVRAHESLAKEFVKVQKFLGQDFCQNALTRSENILLTQKQAKKHNTPICQKDKNYDLMIFGEKDSHTDEASFLFPERKSVKTIGYQKNVFEVFEMIETGQALCGIVPYENSTMGSVFETLDALFEYENIKITALKEVNIHQHLIGLPDAKLTEIKKVISHPQALAQSRRWLRKNLRQAEVRSSLSTATAAWRVKNEARLTSAAIGSEKLAAALDLKILAKNLEQEANKTRFVLIKKGAPPKTTNFTSLVFWFSADKSGSLQEVLSLFAEHKINLTKIDSRRAPKAYGQYLFFVDADVSISNLEKLCPLIEKKVSGIRILGGA